MPILNSRTKGETDDGEPVPAPQGLADLGPIIPVTLTLSDEAPKGLRRARRGLSKSCQWVRDDRHRRK